MRPAGVIPEQRQARRFADYLLTLGIAARLRPAPEGWTVWVVEEEALPRVRDELASFRREPGAARFAVAREAERIRAQSRAAPPGPGAAAPPQPTAWAPWASPTPLTWALLVFVAIAAVMTRLGDPGSPQVARLLPDAAGLSASAPWQWLTPVVVHSGPLHLLFVAAVWPELARRVEARSGTAALAAMVIGFGLLGNVVQTMSFGPACIGLSTPLFGLVGVAAAERSAGAAGELEVVLAAGWLGACLLGLVGPVGGAAHVTALAGGLVVGAIAGRLRARRGRGARPSR